MKNAGRIALLALAALLAGCGGGGGGAASAPPPVSGTPTSPPPPGPVRSDYALVATSPSTTYAAGGAQAAMYATLNGARIAAGAGALTQDAKLDQMAAAHLNYMTLNYPSFGHTETQGQPGFTGASPAARAVAVGYDGSVGEDLAGTTASDPATCVATLLDTVYHQASLMTGYRDVGMAFGPVAQGVYGCVINLGTKTGAYSQLGDAGVVKGFPYGGQTGVETTFVPYSETPNPMPDYTSTNGNWAGVPILASMVNYGGATSYTVNKFVLKDAGGNIVASRLIANASVVAGVGVTLTADPQGFLNAGDVYLVPLSPLVSGQTYSVEFDGKADTVANTKTWSFTTK